MKVTRVSLRGLLASFLVVSATLAVLSVHGLYGIVLLLPPVLAATAIVCLLYKARRFSAAIAFGIYLAVWAVTAIYGVADVERKIAARLKTNHGENLTDGDQFQRLSANSLEDHGLENVEPPWYYVSNGMSPCPLIVNVDWGIMAAPTSGTGGRVYVLWLFGYRVSVHETTHWNS